MKAYYDIVQGTEDWHKIRYAKIGGTLSKGLFIKSDTLAIDIVSQLTEDFELEEDSYASPEMIRGSELEPLAISELEKYTGVKFISAGWLQSDVNELLGISPDGISECETITAETKCPSSKKHITTLLLNDIPNDNIHQCLHYFTVNPKLEKHYFCSFRPESIKRIFVKELTRESLINLGTNAKPNIKTVNEWVKIALDEANILKLDIYTKLEKLKF
jgi:hypothetical protein